MELLAIKPAACLRDLRDVGSHSRNFLQPELSHGFSTDSPIKNAVGWIKGIVDANICKLGATFDKHNRLSSSLSRHFHQTKRSKKQLDLRLPSSHSLPRVLIHLFSPYVAFSASLTCFLWKSFPNISRYYPSNWQHLATTNVHSRTKAAKCSILHERPMWVLRLHLGVPRWSLINESFNSEYTFRQSSHRHATIIKLQAASLRCKEILIQNLAVLCCRPLERLPKNKSQALWLWLCQRA